MTRPTKDRMPKESWAFLLPALAVLAAVVAAVWWWAGWDDAMWTSWAGLFAVLEVHAVRIEAGGDTLSERVHAWFRLKTPAGRAGFFVVLGTLFAWLAWHLPTLLLL